MIDVISTAECTHFMRDCGIPHGLARTTVNNRHSGLIAEGFDRIAAAHWLSEDELVVVETIVTKKE